jgi:hypothetical protein
MAQRAKRFEKEVVEALRTAKIIGLKAGRGEHRFIGLWVVVVEGRAFVRSCGLAERSWYTAFEAEPVGVLQVGERQLAVRVPRSKEPGSWDLWTVRTRSERLKQLVSKAYLEKYHTPGSVKYAREMGRKGSRERTVELAPDTSS